MIPHGVPPCTCDASGEQPECPIHGYEAVIERVEAERDWLREWAEAQCRLRAREYERASDMEPRSISDDEAWALYGPDAQ